MKTILGTIAMALLCMSTKSFAQPCSVTDPSITITNVNPATCVVTFNLTFTAAFNAGNKHAVVHLWEDPSGGYPASITYPATAAATAQAKGTLVIKDPGSATPTYAPSYPVSLGSITSPYLQPTDFKWSDVNGMRTFTFTGLTVPLSSCSTVRFLKGDVYATQNDNNASGGCISRGSIILAANDPSMRGLMICSNPRSFTLSFSTLNATSISFKAFKDVEPFGIFDDNDEQAANLLDLTDANGTSSGKTVANPGQTAGQYTNYGPYTYSQQPSGSQFGVWVVAVAGTNTYNNILLIENTCSILPVVFESFNVTKNQSTVQLKWTTDKEENNAGFYVERKMGTDTWRSINFVASKSNGGNSGEKTYYEYTDNVNFDGVIQYRLKQMDIDGRSKYSEIKTVKGSGQGNELSLFPNPAKGGNFTILLSSNDVHSIQVIDASGRAVMQFSNVKGSKSVAGLKPGQYLVITENTQTSARATQKIIVQ
jgi:hypothetical protein